MLIREQQATTQARQQRQQRQRRQHRQRQQGSRAGLVAPVLCHWPLATSRHWRPLGAATLVGSWQQGGDGIAQHCWLCQQRDCPSMCGCTLRLLPVAWQLPAGSGGCATPASCRGRKHGGRRQQGGGKASAARKDEPARMLLPHGQAIIRQRNGRQPQLEGLPGTAAVAAARWVPCWQACTSRGMRAVLAGWEAAPGPQQQQQRQRQVVASRWVAGADGQSPATCTGE